MLYATWSLTEAPLAARAPLLEQCYGFGYFFLAGMRQWEGIDNLRYLQHLVRSDLLANYSTCAWFHERSYSQSFYFVAVRRTLGTALCDPAVWCTRTSWIGGISTCAQPRPPQGGPGP